MSKQKELSQWHTPRWASEALLEKVGFRPGEVVLEPSCGDGSFLQAIPDEYEAVGIEIDEAMAEAARANSGRTVIVGDFRHVDIPIRPTLVVGNPPFKTDLVLEFLERSYQLLPDQGRVAFLLSTHILQTPSNIVALSEKWGMDHMIMPRTLFNRASRPLSFLQLVKGGKGMRGMFLYHQAYFFNRLPLMAKKIANQGRGSVWLRVVSWAMSQSGGAADLPELYRLVGQNPPTTNKFYKEKIRQVLQQNFKQLSRGRWTFKDAN